MPPLPYVSMEHIKQSNLIENVRGYPELEQSAAAWTHLDLRSGDLLNLRIILDTHRLIMVNIWPAIAGRWRDMDVEVSGQRCPPWRDVPVLMARWINMMQEFKKRDPKKMHVEFERIHPFRDGNGRVGRMLMWWHEIRLGREPTLINYEDRHDYYEWFAK